MMTSAVGPADVSVDRSTLTGQRSTVKGHGVKGQRAPPVSLSPRLTDGPHGSGRVKEKGYGSVSGPKGSGPARGPVKLGSARGAARDSARPAAQQAGSGSGPAARGKRLGLKPSADRLPLLPGLGLLFSLSFFWLGRRSVFCSSRAGGVASFSPLTGRVQVSATVGSGVAARIRCS
jgi:hypothetical protein